MIFKRLKKSTKEEEAQFSRMLEEEQVGWKDKLAMLIAAFFTIMLPCVAVLLGFAAVILWILGLITCTNETTPLMRGGLFAQTVSSSYYWYFLS